MVECWSLVTGSHHSGFIYIWDFLKWIQNMQGKKDESVYVLHSLIIFHLQRINNPNHVERKPVDDLILAAASKGQSVSIFKPSPTPRRESGGSRMLCKRPRWQASSVSWTGREPQEVDHVPRGDSLWWEGARDTDGPAEREREGASVNGSMQRAPKSSLGYSGVLWSVLHLKPELGEFTHIFIN